MLRRVGNVYTLVALGGLVVGVLKALGVVALMGTDPVGVGVIVVSAALLVFGLVRGGKKSPSSQATEGNKLSPPEPTGVLADIEHREGCGATAYRHGDRPANPEPFDTELHALLSHGRGISDDYLLGGGLSSINRAQRDESYRWTRDTASALKARDPALAERFLAAGSHSARLSILADILGVDEL